MNKKISTLLAGVALLGAMTANAAGTPVKSFDKTSKNLYQLKFTNNAAEMLLGMEATGKLTATAEAGLASADLASTLWCVEVLDENNGQNVIYNFVNKATGQRLDINYAGTALEILASDAASGSDVIVGGEIAGWAFSPQYKADMKPSTIYSHFKSDSVIGLVNNSGAIDVKKAGSAAAAAGTASFTTFTLQTAGAVRLNAAEINSKLGILTAGAEKTGIKLNFEPNEKGVENFTKFVKNPFATDKFLAEDVTVTGEEAYVYILKTDSSYLYVDTAYTNTSGSKFLAFNWSKLDYATRMKGTDKHADAPTAIAASDLKDQYKFAFTYYPSIDSLIIQVKKVVRTTDAVTTWAAALATTANATDATLDNLAGATGTAGAKNFVTVQDLIKDNVRIITIADKKESKIKLGYEGCVPTDLGKHSIGNGLYIIKNAQGQVLASPIHKNGAFEWVKLDEQTAEHMPAYQWLIWQNQTTAAMKETSPITITNREFKDASAPAIQLYKKDGKVTSAAFRVNGFPVVLGTELTFIQITDSTIIKDKYLGYKNLKADDLQITKYKFNYLHPFNQNKWINKGADADSVLYAQDAYTAFTITNGKEVQYGATGGTKINGLADLYRTQYLVTIGADTLATAAQNKYAVGKVGKAGVVDSFYFKENNHHNDNHYYAIVKAYMNEIAEGTEKVGVADDGLTANLKVQPLKETRTSAFAIFVDSLPLYRRFNNAALGESDDKPDSLRFYESARGEYLMDENNSTFQDPNVDYLGIWTADKATGLSFRIDTAWVKRGLGYIKPQYLVSVANQVIGATEGTICKEPGDHITADGKITNKAEDCKHSHAGKAGFVYGKYLVSFADSVAKAVDKKPYTDITNGYTRVGFVKAIKSDNKLFILVNGFEKMDPTTLDTLTIAKAYTAAKIYDKYVVSLDGDKHKNYTWSFRYIYPNKAANVTEEHVATNSFLFESNQYDEKAIAPEKAAWIKMQNGCIVLTNKTSTFSSAKTGGDGALVFNVDNIANDELATDNETITNSEVSVIAAQGQVTIAGAEGKKVVISNILGQVVANTVISSSSATIAVPAGVVVVAVEGEAAVKAIVR